MKESHASLDIYISQFADFRNFVNPGAELYRYIFKCKTRKRERLAPWTRVSHTGGDSKFPRKKIVSKTITL